MRWKILLLVGVIVFAMVDHLWPPFPAIGCAAGLGYVCGVERWRGKSD